jgi:hypothetical protein
MCCFEYGAEQYTSQKWSSQLEERHAIEVIGGFSNADIDEPHAPLHAYKGGLLEAH